MKSSRTTRILLICLVMLPIFLFIGSHRGEDFLYKKSVPVVVSDLLELSYALENFKKEKGRYPTHKENLQILLPPPSQNQKRWNGPYLQPRVLELTTNLIKDVWGTPYIYLYPAQYGTEVYDLYSCGKNRKNDFGEHDDVTFWKEPHLNYYSEKERGTIDPLSQFKGYLLVIVLIGIWGFLSMKNK